MSDYLITDDDKELIKQVALIQIVNESVESKWNYEKSAGRGHMFEMSSKPWSSNIKDRLKKSARHLVPTEIKSIRLTELGCKHYDCPSTIRTRKQPMVDINKMRVSELTKDNLYDVSDYCLEKYRRRIMERDDPKMKSPYDSIGHLQWRTMSDGRMGCSQDNELFRNWMLFPLERAGKPTKGVTDAPPFVLHDDNQFDMTESYCKFKGVSYKPADKGKHNDDCYVGRGQAVVEAILGYWPRDLYPA